MRIFKSAHDAADKQRADRAVIADALAANRTRADLEAARSQPSQPAMSSEETEALQKARYSAALETRRQKAEEIKALVDLRNQAQDIADTATQARDWALLPEIDLEKALDASIRIVAMASLIAYIDEGGSRRFGGSWRPSR